MIDTAFLIGTAALLAAPGPTNSLLFASAATCQDVRGWARLVVAAMAGYFAAVSALLALGGPAFAAMPLLESAMRTAVCIYLFALAWRLWRNGQAPKTRVGIVVTPRQIGATTLLNPKGMVVAFGLMPTSAANSIGEAMPYLGAFLGLVLLSSTVWLAAGTLVAHRAPALQHPAICCRLAAVAMLVFGGIIGSTLAETIM